MRYVFDHDLHIHSYLSGCSDDPEQNPQRMLQYAKEFGLKQLCITDHFWDEKVPGAENSYLKGQGVAHISRIKPLPQADGIEFLFGCETDMDQNMQLGVSKETMDLLDFIVIPTTHMHMVGFVISEEDCTIEGKARVWVERLEALLAKDLPFHKIGIAHLTCSLIDSSSRENYIKVLNLLREEDLYRVFKKAAEVGCGIELNSDDMRLRPGEEEAILRIYRIAKECGCKFYGGSDAHHPATLDAAKAIYERAIDLLELDENDKFHIIKK